VDSLAAVRRINCWGLGLTDIGVLGRTPGLQVASLSMNDIVDMAPLRLCGVLQELYLRKNRIGSHQLPLLAALPALRILWLADNPAAADPHYRRHCILWAPTLVTLDQADVTAEEARAVDADPLPAAFVASVEAGVSLLRALGIPPPPRAAAVASRAAAIPTAATPAAFTPPPSRPPPAASRAATAAVTAAAAAARDDSKVDDDGDDSTPVVAGRGRSGSVGGGGAPGTAAVRSTSTGSAAPATAAPAPAAAARKRQHSRPAMLAAVLALLPALDDGGLRDIVRAASALLAQSAPPSGGLA